MATQLSFRHFSTSELDTGLRYAKEQKGIVLDRDMLRRLANNTGIQWYRDGRKSGLLKQAERQVLLEIPQRDLKEAERRDAYNVAICKMFSDRSHHATQVRAARRARTPEPSGVDRSLISIDGKGQYLLML